LGGKGVQAGCHQKRDDWLDARPRRQKALRQEDRGRDRQQKNKRRMDWDNYDYRQPRFGDSREELRVYDDRFNAPVRYHERYKEDFDRSSRRGLDGDRGEGKDRLGAGETVQTDRRTTALNVRCLQERQSADARIVHQCEEENQDNEYSKGSQLKTFVTFYFTNSPAQLSNFYLRKGFEVCGMLDEVIVSSKRNANGDCYGFVRFANVCNVSKLLKTVNDVCFGNFRIRAKIARFDRSAAKVLVREGEGEGVGKTSMGGGENKMSLGEGVKKVSVVRGKQRQ